MFGQPLPLPLTDQFFIPAILLAISVLVSLLEKRVGGIREKEDTLSYKDIIFSTNMLLAAIGLVAGISDVSAAALLLPVAAILLHTIGYSFLGPSKRPVSSGLLMDRMEDPKVVSPGEMLGTVLAFNIYGFVVFLLTWWVWWLNVGAV